MLVFVAGAYARLVRRFTTGDIFIATEPLEWVRTLEANWQVMRDEFDQLRGQRQLPALIDVIPGERTVIDARWKMLMLRYLSKPVLANCALCPRTATLLKRVPGLVSANFSVLEPGARIAPHRGIFAGVLRYHLGLLVPAADERCALRVGDEIRHWREGRSLLFDDTHRHEAWNLTDEDRVVLLLDVARPLPAPLRRLNDAVLLLLSRVMMGPLADAERMVAKLRGGDAGAER